MKQQSIISEDALKVILEHIKKPPQNWLMAVVLSVIVSLPTLEAILYEFVLTDDSVYVALIYYSWKFDPDKFDANAEKRFDVLSGLKVKKSGVITR